MSSPNAQWTRGTEFDVALPEIEDIRIAADLRLRSAGPIFLNDRGAAVHFNDLDFGRQVGIKTYHTFPLDPPELAKAWKKRTHERTVDLTASGSSPSDGGTGVRRADSAVGEQQAESQSERVESGSEIDEPLRTPHELLSFSDEARTVVRRKQPSIERNWHVSKCRKSLAEMVWDEVGGFEGVFTKATQYRGMRKPGWRDERW